MAIVRGFALHRVSGKVGNQLYRWVNGQQVQQELPAEKATTRVPSEAQSLAKRIFTFVNRFASLHAADIKVSFNKTKHGSERNYFVKLNYTQLKLAFAELAENNSDATLVTDDAIEAAVAEYATANPTAIYRVKKTGYPIVYLTGAWDENDNPTGALSAQVSALTIKDIAMSNNGAVNISWASGDSLPVVIIGSNLLNVSAASVTINSDSQPVAITSQTDTKIEGTIVSGIAVASDTEIALNVSVALDGRNKFAATVTANGEVNPLG